MDTTLNLNEFTPLSPEDWRDKIIAETGVKDIKELTTTPSSGIQIHPLHTNLEAATPLPKERKEWTIVHPHGNIKNESEDNKQLLHALVAGANGIYLVLNGPTNWKALLKDIELAYITLYVFADNAEWCDALESHIIQHHPETNAEVYYSCIGWTAKTNRKGCNSIGVDFHQNDALVPSVLLGLAIAQCHEWLQSNTSTNGQWYALPTAGHYFLDILQLRALRLLHHYLLEKNERTKIDPHVFVRSNMRNKSTEDVYGNMLRNTTEGMGALLGGANALCLEPHNAATGKVDNFGHRIARNTQLIFQYEAHLNANIDPTSGSFFFENQTCELASQAWSTFRAIEAEGGYLAMANRGELTTFIKTHSTK